MRFIEFRLGKNSSTAKYANHPKAYKGPCISNHPAGGTRFSANPSIFLAFRLAAAGVGLRQGNLKMATTGYQQPGSEFCRTS
jgi:hypothetical protein